MSVIGLSPGVWVAVNASFSHNTYTSSEKQTILQLT